MRHGGRHRQPRPHRLAVQPLLVSGRGLQRVSERMAEIQERPFSLLAFVAAHDRRLDLAGTADDVRERRRLTREQGIQVRLQPREQRRIADQPVLDHFGESGAQFARWQGGERVRVAHHRRRLVEGADQVLAARMVDAGLAAHRRIHLREQRRGHLHEHDAALVGGGREAGEIPDHPAPQGKDRAIAPKTVGDEHIQHAGDVGEGLVGLAIRQDHGHEPPRPESHAQCGQVQRRDGGVADYEHIARRHLRVEHSRATENPGIDQDRVAAGTEFDVQGVHVLTARAGNQARHCAGVYVSGAAGRAPPGVLLSVGRAPRRARAGCARRRSARAGRRSARRCRQSPHTTARAVP